MKKILMTLGLSISAGLTVVLFIWLFTVSITLFWWILGIVVAGAGIWLLVQFLDKDSLEFLAAVIVAGAVFVTMATLIGWGLISFLKIWVEPQQPECTFLRLGGYFGSGVMSIIILGMLAQEVYKFWKWSGKVPALWREKWSKAGFWKEKFQYTHCKLRIFSIYLLKFLFYILCVGMAAAIIYFGYVYFIK